MSRPNWRIYTLVVLLSCSLTIWGVLVSGQTANYAQATILPARPAAPVGPVPDALKNMPDYMKLNHGMYDNQLTAMYEQWLVGERVGVGLKSAPANSQLAPRNPFNPLYGLDVRMSNAAFAGTQNEFQVDINPTNTAFALGSSNDGRTAGVGIYRTADGGLTWTAQDAPISTTACCDPAVAYSFDGIAYVGVLDTSPGGEYIIKSTDNGLTWSVPVFITMPDRNNLVVDNGATSPRIGTIYTTYSDLPTTNRIKGYKSTDGGATWGTSFLIGDVAPASGYEQSSQPRVASDGTLYVGYQQYLNSGAGCAAGVQNVLARSTNGGTSWTYTVLNITQGGACSSGQAGRGIFCINAGGSSFRSRSHPIIGVHPTNPNIVYMVYSGGDLETAYTCGGFSGFHSDTLFRKSTNGGATFSAPAKINTDAAGKDQYFPWIDVAANGTLWVGWNDRRDDPNNFLSKWYQAFSTDEGATWTESVVADVQTLPSTFIGDYHGLAAENDRVLGMWYDSRNSASGDPYTDPAAPIPGGSTSTPTRTPTITLTPTRTPTRTSTPTFTFTSTSTRTNTPTNTPTRTSTFTSTPTNTPTLTFTPTPSSNVDLVGHVTWQGALPQPHIQQQVPITLTLRSTGGGPDTNYPTQTTDANGQFTTTTGLPTGAYLWRVKSPKFLANSGTTTLTGPDALRPASVTYQEMGLMRAGDADDNNVVNSTDFSILKNTFGKGLGDPGYDPRADFNNDNVVNSTDFNLLRGNFGTGGAPPIRP